jgi:acyl-CoA thioester hydrolase
MFSSDTHIRVRYAETDQMGVVYHANYFPYFESARTESIRQLGFTYADMERMGVIMPVVDVHCRYLRPARYDDLLTIRTIVKELPVHHKIEFHHEVYNETEELLATGKITLYFMEAKTMKRTTMPAALMDKIKPYFENREMEKQING